MVERKEYESYIRSRVEKLLQSTSNETYELIAQIRGFANSLPSAFHKEIDYSQNATLPQIQKEFKNDLKIIEASSPTSAEEFQNEINKLIANYFSSSLPIITNIKQVGYSLKDKTTINKVTLSNDTWLENKEVKEKIEKYFNSEAIVEYINKKYYTYNTNTLNILRQIIEKVISENQGIIDENIIINRIKQIFNKADTLREYHKEASELTAEIRKTILNDRNIIIPLLLNQRETRKLNDIDVINILIKNKTALDFISFLNKNNEQLIIQEFRSKYSSDTSEKEEFDLIIDSIIKELITSNQIINNYNYNIDESLFRRELYKQRITDLIKSTKRKRLELDTTNKQVIINDTVEKIMSEIIHTSAHKPLSIVKYPDANIAQINSIFVPLNFVEELLKEREKVIETGMKNSYIFLSDYVNLYFDEDNNKYLLPNQDVHIFGLEGGEKGLIKIIKYLRTANINDGQSTEENTILSNEQTKLPNDIFEELKKCLSENINNDGTTRLKTLEEQAREFDRAQLILNKLIIPRTIDDNIELLTYFIIKENIKSLNINNLKNVLTENSIFFDLNFLNIFNGKQTQKILKKVSLLIGDRIRSKEIKEKYEELFALQNILISKHQKLAIDIIKNTTLSEKELDKNAEKNEEKLMQKIATYFGASTKSLDLNQNNNIYTIYEDKNKIFTIVKEENFIIIKNNNDKEICKITNYPNLGIITQNQNYIIEITSYGTLQISDKNKTNEIYSFDIGERIESVKVENRKANLFGLVHKYIELKSNEFMEKINNNNLYYYLEDFNFIKIYDKLIYLNLFNFMLDLENVYILDLQNYIKMDQALSVKNEKKPEAGLICEISAFQEKVFVLFEKIFNGITRFVSIQGVSESNTIISDFSTLPMLTEFNNKTYKTLLGLTDSSSDKVEETFFSTHTSITKSNDLIKDLIASLKDSSLVLRYATSSNKAIETIKNKQTSAKEISIDELIDRTIKGVSNTILWLSVITDEELKTFLKKRNVTQENLKEIKQLFFLQLYKNIDDIITFLKDKILKTNNPKEKDSYTSYIKRLEQYTNINNSSLLELYEKVLAININDENTYDFLVNESISNYEYFEIVNKIMLELPPFMTEHLIISDDEIFNIKNNRFRTLLLLINYSHKRQNLSLEKIEKIAINKETYKKLVFIEQKLNSITNFENNIIRNNISYDSKTIALQYIKLLEQKKYYIQQKKIILKKELELIDNNSLSFNINILKTKRKQRDIKKELELLESEVEIQKQIDTQKKYLLLKEGNISELDKIELLKTLIFNNKYLSRQEVDEVNFFLKTMISPNRISESKYSEEIDVLNILSKKRGTINRIEDTIENKLKVIINRIRNDNSFVEESIEEQSNMSNSIKENIEQLKELMITEYYPTLFEIVNNSYSVNQTQKKKELLKYLVTRIKTIFHENNVEFITYEQLIADIHLKKSEEKCSMAKKIIIGDIKNKTLECDEFDEEQQRLLQNDFERLLEEVLNAYEKILPMSITSIVNNSHSLIGSDIKEQLENYIQEQIPIKTMIINIIKVITKSLKENSKSTIGELLINIYNPKLINKVNELIKNYYQWLIELPNTIKLNLRENIFGEHISESTYIELVNLHFKDMIKELRILYGDAIFDPINNEYGERSSIKKS